MTSKFERQLQASNVVASYDGGDENTPTVTLLGSYWGNIKRSKQEIIQRRVVCVKIKRVA